MELLLLSLQLEKEYCITALFALCFNLLIQVLISLLQLRNVNLSCVRTCMVVAEERPRIALTQSFSKIFKDLGLSPRAVSTTFGCRVNVAICLQVSSWWRRKRIVPQFKAIQVMNWFRSTSKKCLENMGLAVKWLTASVHSSTLKRKSAQEARRAEWRRCDTCQLHERDIIMNSGWYMDSRHWLWKVIRWVKITIWSIVNNFIS